MDAPLSPLNALSGRAAVDTDRRGSWVPTYRMVTTRFMELRRRRGLMIALVVVNIGIPTVFLAIRLLLHAVDAKTYGPAGGYDTFTNIVAGVMYVFGFIIAATLGCTAGSADLTEGMFRHLVVTGRSRLALYLARIPAGLAIIVPMVAVGFAVVCMVCVLAAPKVINYNGVSVPAGLSQTGFETWAGNHTNDVICQFGYGPKANVNIACRYNPRTGGVIDLNQSLGKSGLPPTPAQIKSDAIRIAQQDYPAYKLYFLSPPISLMVSSGLWIELEAVIGFIVGLGLASLIGQRTVSVILMIVLELILTPLFSRAHVPHMINVQRGIVGLATAHLEPSGLPLLFGGDGGGPSGVRTASLLVPETRTVAVLVIIGWLVVWTGLGAWRMMTRDA